FERRLHDLVGRAGIRGRFENDQLTGLQARTHGIHGQDDIGEIRVAGLAKRRRHADVDRVHVVQLRHVVGRGQLLGLDGRGKLGARDVADVALALVDGVDLVEVDVEPGNLEPGLREFNRQRQADVPKTNDADLRLLLLNLLFQFQTNLRSLYRAA